MVTRPAPERAVEGSHPLTVTFAYTFQNFKEYSASTRTLQKVELPIVSAENCQKTYPILFDEIQICSGAESGLYTYLQNKVWVAVVVVLIPCARYVKPDFLACLITVTGVITSGCIKHNFGEKSYF